jgi:hypothetical protein
MLTLGDDMSMRSYSMLSDFSNQNLPYGIRVEDDRNSDVDSQSRKFSLNFEMKIESSTKETKPKQRSSFNLGNIFRKMKFDRMGKNNKATEDTSISNNLIN